MWNAFSPIYSEIFFTHCKNLEEKQSKVNCYSYAWKVEEAEHSLISLERAFVFIYSKLVGLLRCQSRTIDGAHGKQLIEEPFNLIVGAGLQWTRSFVNLPIFCLKILCLANQQLFAAASKTNWLHGTACTLTKSFCFHIYLQWSV